MYEALIGEGKETAKIKVIDSLTGKTLIEPIIVPKNVETELKRRIDESEARNETPTIGNVFGHYFGEIENNRPTDHPKCQLTVRIPEKNQKDLKNELELTFAKIIMELYNLHHSK